MPSFDFQSTGTSNSWGDAFMAALPDQQDPRGRAHLQSSLLAFHLFTVIGNGSRQEDIANYMRNLAA